MEAGPQPDEPLAWSNVGIATGLLLINGAISLYMGLRLEKSLIISGVRSVVQLTLMGMILEDVFKTKNPFIIFGMAGVLVLLGAYETTFNKSKRRHSGMFISVLISMFCSTLLIGLIGNAFAMNVSPVWTAHKFIPTLGMLLGNCMTGMALGISSCLNQFCDNKERLEMSLGLGASRWEAGRPVAVEAIRVAMLPTINSMSVMGLISIPGMMTGQILGGAPVMDAVKYQQIIMFMIAASTSLGTLGAVLTCISICLDSDHRLRLDRIYNAGQSSIFTWATVKDVFSNSKPASSAPETRSLLAKVRNYGGASRHSSSTSV
ncbi:UPF0014-domain-containing protein [Basidiobolus meristosporus CBS 931.73]|uniref:UPF0014-domain-containing protein n=1 Tax=Basidiobolus meristosporus CBS 931.73 TaxID=1314790 RepID=A0A1Y1YDL6_9FUNG|nr:UPF0014-domain-containing protein [Basidiobolus meristosporus CBS 931.73]|eukprot:ORX95816.1 UPF0014-domain-containing protein [Basidiobolus meristosporus CBS 931.73]